MLAIFNNSKRLGGRHNVHLVSCRLHLIENTVSCKKNMTNPFVFRKIEDKFHVFSDHIMRVFLLFFQQSL